MWFEVISSLFHDGLIFDSDVARSTAADVEAVTEA